MALRAGALLAVSALAAAVALVIAAANGSAAQLSHGCGHDRWPVKTLADPDRALVDLHASPIRVQDLVQLEAPERVRGTLPRQTGFNGIELQTFRIRALLVGWKISRDDKDIHLVVADPQTLETMIIELPKLSCVGRHARARTKMRAARKAAEQDCADVTLNASFHRMLGVATIEGVGFFDRIHNQIGVADNGIELHPVLRFTSSNCRTA
jgi:hypothetical protein